MTYGSGGRRLRRRSGPAVSERWGGARSAVGPSPGVEVTRGGAGRVGVSVRAAHGRFAGRTGPGGGGERWAACWPGPALHLFTVFYGIR